MNCRRSLRLAFAALFFLTTHAWAERCIVISVPDQKLTVLQNGFRIVAFRISTSKFGLGDGFHSYATPLGALEVADKIGAGAPAGAVFKGCRQTGEVLSPNEPNRDPIVTRILRLRGLEASNAHAYERGIYIHGTAAERAIGRPASYGCIRMRSRDVMQVFEVAPIGTRVEIVNERLSRVRHEAAGAHHIASIAVRSPKA